MKKLYWGSLVIILLVVSMVFGVPVTADDTQIDSHKPLSSNESSNFQIKVTVNGLEAGETAVLRLATETDAKNIIAERTVVGNSEKRLTSDINSALKDGNYQLMLEAPSKYFRDPKGYFFNISQAQLVNPMNRSFTFNLKAITDQDTIETIIDLSAPTKLPISK